MPDLENDNPIAQGAAASPPAQSAPSPSPIMDAFSTHLANTKARFDKTSEVSKNFATVRAGLDSLVKMGDAVTSDDVIEEIGKLVAQGLSPEPLIAMMAGDPQNGVPPMPESGQALAAWVQSHEQQFVQQEQQLAQVHSMAQHQLGVAGVQGLLIHHIEAIKGQGQGPAPKGPGPAPTPPPSNPLAAGAPSNA